MSIKRQKSWFIQAESDFRAAQGMLRMNLYSHVCFLSQQVAEKCLKAIAYSRDYDFVKSHSLVEISKDLGINGQLEDAARVLDLYYISARYPDALPDHIAPTLSFGKAQAEEALEKAIKFIEAAREIV